MKISTDNLQYFSMSKLGKVGEYEVRAVSILIHFNVKLKLGVIYFSSSCVNLRLGIVIAIFIFLLTIFLSVLLLVLQR